MKNIVIIAYLLLSLPLFAQRGKPAITELQGKQLLEQFASTYNDKASWEKKAVQIRQNILEGFQLDQLPTKTPLNPIIRNKKVLNGYTVENVAFESMPGFWVTGNLYKPINAKGKLPGILCPTGHSKNTTEARADADWQKLCAGLARMGAVVLSYDMLGYSESTQCTHTIPIASKIQTWNSIRAIDFLLSLKNVDAKRIAVTGYSGGGTQTFLLSAVDKRVAVSAPVAMVSAHFYGGCVCESGMPIHAANGIETNNVEIAALVAPKSMILVSDGKDWTKNTPDIEFPYIKNIYSFYDATQNVENAHFPGEGHDYGFNKRKAVYAFLARHLRLDITYLTNQSNDIDESFVSIQPYTSLSVFDDNVTRPANAVIGDVQVIKLFSIK